MLKYVSVDSDGYAWLGRTNQIDLQRLGYGVGRTNDEWFLFRITDPVSGGYHHELIYETTDHVLFDNYLKLLLED
jgi:hypothetical protein